MHRVAIVALDGVIPFDLAIPIETLETVALPSGSRAYEVRVCGVAQEVDTGAFRMTLRYGLAELSNAHTIILPGLRANAPIPDALVHTLKRAARKGARIASICSGAFILAATGLLDGRRATTHWRAAEELARRHPRVTVEPNVLFVDEGQFLTSAGASAGLDLCLHLVRCDYGAAVAAHAARLAVVPLLRDGGQAQYVVQTSPLAPVLTWAEKNLDKPIALQDFAKQAAMSVRTLNRHFKQQVGLTPLHWLIKARVHRAQVLLETTALSIDAIATCTGFGSTSTLRTHFQRVAGTSPLAYRKAFRGAA